MSSKNTTKKHLPAHGLKNKGNTCFFNASMQCFLSLPKFTKFFLETSFNQTKQPFCVAMQNFILAYKKNPILDPSDFISSIRSKIKLFSGRQQDAHEFIESLLTRLCDECNDRELGNVLKDILGISLEDSVKCHECGYTSVNKTPTLMKYLFIKKSVQESLDSYLQLEEIIDEESPWICPKCNKGTPSGINHCIRKASDYFILYLNRFQSTILKNTSKIHVDEKINILGQQYEVEAMVCHSGTLSSGHYYAYCKRDLWMECNDSLIRPIEKPDPESSVYVLFYSRIDEP